MGSAVIKAKTPSFFLVRVEEDILLQAFLAEAVNSTVVLSHSLSDYEVNGLFHSYWTRGMLLFSRTIDWSCV